MRIGLVGFFGWGNFGDELFVRAHEQHLSEVGEVAVINDLTKKPYFTKPLDQIVDEHDCFVIGGGDLVIPWSVSELYWKAEYLKKPVFVVGVGVPTWGGYKEDKVARYREFFASDMVKTVIARDPESAAWIEKHVQPHADVQFFPDLVCAMDLPEAEKPDEKILGVSLRSRRGGEDDLTQVRRLCERAKKMDYQVRHVVLANQQTGEADEAVIRGFAEDGEEVIAASDEAAMCCAIGECSAYASMKFHGTVVAAMYGVPSIVLSATDKSRNFMRMVERPDLISSIADPRLRMRLPLVPAPIHSLARDRLREQAQAGYAALRAAIRQHVG